MSTQENYRDVADTRKRIYGALHIQEKNMKKLTLVLLVAAGMLSGCVAYDPNHGQHREGAHRDADRDGMPNRMDKDRDGDGIRNRDDARPNNPSRY